MGGPALSGTAMGTVRFEGSDLGDGSKLPAHARLECKICWWVYDPADGDPAWQIPPGVAFSALPTHRRCPSCDGGADQFMVLNDDGGTA